MKIILYCLVYSLILISLFLSCIYLMTIIDPGLMEIADKVRLTRKDRIRDMDGKPILVCNLSGIKRNANDKINPQVRIPMVLSKSSSLVSVQNRCSKDIFIMGKGTIFVVTYSIVLLALFGIFSYLMSVVEPNVYSDGNGDKSNGKEKESVSKVENSSGNSRKRDAAKISDYKQEAQEKSGHQNINELKFANYEEDYLNQIFIPGNEEGYGLEKFTGTVETNTKTSTLYPLHQKTHPPRKDSLIKHDERIYSDNKVVVTPCVAESCKISVEAGMDAVFKGLRRSIYNTTKQGTDNSGSIILKIIDEAGDPKIEIKLGKGRRKSKKNDDSKKSKPKFRLSLYNSNNNEFKSDLGTNTIIKIMPNDTLLVKEEVESSVSNHKDADNNNSYTSSTMMVNSPKKVSYITKLFTNGSDSFEDSYVTTKYISFMNQTAYYGQIINIESNNTVLNGEDGLVTASLFINEKKEINSTTLENPIDLINEVRTENEVDHRTKIDDPKIDCIETQETHSTPTVYFTVSQTTKSDNILDGISELSQSDFSPVNLGTNINKTQEVTFNIVGNFTIHKPEVMFNKTNDNCSSESTDVCEGETFVFNFEANQENLTVTPFVDGNEPKSISTDELATENNVKNKHLEKVPIETSNENIPKDHGQYTDVLPTSENFIGNEERTTLNENNINHIDTS